MSIMNYNGGVVIAMKGKDCVAIATDTRLGVRSLTLTTDFPKVFQMGPTLFLGLPGLATDTMTVYQRLRFRLNMYELRENKRVRPQVFTSMVSNLLYERRFGPYFVEPVVAGLDKDGTPYIASMDLIGSYQEPEDICVAGTCSEQAYGMAEALWEKDMDADKLFEAISQSLMNACDRDAISGQGAIVHIVEKNKITTKTLKMRMD
ncbi:proteasome beta 3 subunit-like protein [Dinothrombium tinctorium]|uniref:Proteasome subunit beta n=1 Tax=Dinothrombium tinctorium TaxID=1965070 RepID=A0A443R606_9ACAR|nr:proteasome beta 3 subunit-like protein [Dinothrombium tinctorium]